MRNKLVLKIAIGGTINIPYYLSLTVVDYVQLYLVEHCKKYEKSILQEMYKTAKRQ